MQLFLVCFPTRARSYTAWEQMPANIYLAHHFYNQHSASTWHMVLGFGFFCFFFSTITLMNTWKFSSSSTSSIISFSITLLFPDTGIFQHLFPCSPLGTVHITHTWQIVSLNFFWVLRWAITLCCFWVFTYAIPSTCNTALLIWPNNPTQMVRVN